MNNEMNFNIDVADRCGVNAATVATFLWHMLAGDPESIYRHGNEWTRISQKEITAHLPFLTLGMVQGALRKLRDEGVIKSAVLNNNKFDHTNWYTFTEYGDVLMME
jgi:hypothetical protein